ncbi:MAG: hypothetical protein FJ027_00270 [Candidatus Rokubacteria bacterium]|nr:hypothetical protein [Candidatus Rokubacteria bacterium]
MTLSLTEWLQQNRLVVVSVDPAKQRVRLKGVADVCTDVSCSERTVIVTEDDRHAGLGALNAGDIVRLDGGSPGQPERIVIVRRVWEELTSPEF